MTEPEVSIKIALSGDFVKQYCQELLSAASTLHPGTPCIRQGGSCAAPSPVSIPGTHSISGATAIIRDQKVYSPCHAFAVVHNKNTTSAICSNFLIP